MKLKQKLIKFLGKLNSLKQTIQLLKCSHHQITLKKWLKESSCCHKLFKLSNTSIRLHNCHLLELLSTSQQKNTQSNTPQFQHSFMHHLMIFWRNSNKMLTVNLISKQLFQSLRLISNKFRSGLASLKLLKSKNLLKKLFKKKKLFLFHQQTINVKLVSVIWLRNWYLN